LSGSSLAVASACGVVDVAVTAVFLSVFQSVFLFLTVTVVLGRYFGDLSTLLWLGVEERLNAKLGSFRVFAWEHTKLTKKLNGGKGT